MDQRHCAGDDWEPLPSRCTQIDGGTVIFAPVNSPVEAANCDLVAVDRNGSATNRLELPPDACNIHGDGIDEVLVATTAESIVAYDARTGGVELRADLTWWGYSVPIVVGFAETPEREVIGTFDPRFVPA